jgi:hypothetical protein
MKRIVSVVLLAGLLSGCGPPAQQVRVETEERYTGCVPQDLHVESSSGRMVVIWTPDCPSLSGGYNVYITERGLVSAYPGRELPASVRPHNAEVFPGDTDPDDPREHYTAEGLRDGVKYYVSVRTVFADGSLSKPSNEVITSCGLRREIELPVRYTSERDGFSLAGNDYVGAGDPTNDAYFFSKDGQDYLVSPSELDGFLRVSKLRVLPFTGNLDEVVKEVLTLSSIPAGSRVEVKEGDWVQLLTADNKNALLQVLQIVGQGRERRITLFVAYSAVAGEIVL